MKVASASTLPPPRAPHAHAPMSSSGVAHTLPLYSCCHHATRSMKGLLVQLQSSAALHTMLGSRPHAQNLSGHCATVSFTQ